MQHYNRQLLRHLRSTIGRNIHQRRSHQKITLRKLAKKTGIPETRLDQYELGKNEIRLDELLKIACTLKTQMETLVTASQPT